MIFFSGLEGSAVGVGSQTVGKGARHKRCQIHDVIQLFPYLDGDTLSPVRRLSVHFALSSNGTIASRVLSFLSFVFYN